MRRRIAPGGYNMAEEAAMKFIFYCTHRRWIGRPDPSGFGRFTFRTTDPDRARERFSRAGVRVDRVERVGAS